MVELLIKSKIKDVVQEKGFKVSADLYTALSKEVEASILKSIDRAEANGRRTVLVRDI